MLIKVALALVAAMITLEGLIITLWPARVKQWIETSTPAQLRSVAIIEFLLGITIFGYLIFRL